VKKIVSAFALIVALFAFSGAVSIGTITLVSAHVSTAHVTKHVQSHFKCKHKRAYTHCKCKGVGPGDKARIPIGHGVFLIAQGQSPNGVEAFVCRAANPCTAHPNAIGFRVFALDPVTGNPITTFNPPFLVSKGTVYAFNSSTGACTGPLPKNAKGQTPITQPGIYAVVP
jgi:hypothetical protein